jgi:cytochrome b6-f complex iron-sulfur subunit
MVTPNLDRGHPSESSDSPIERFSPKETLRERQRPNHFNRRHFLRYLLGSATGTIAIGMLFPNRSASVEATLEDLCSASPLNSRCQNYLPGEPARDEQGNAIAADALIAQATVGEPVAVKGLSDPNTTYLIITDEPAIAPYAIKPRCTHLGCTVNWKPEQHRFVCPCHGSQYDEQGRVIHGPARRSLPLRTVVVKQNQVRLVDHAPAIDPR